jgi:DNA-binding transcriptional LysR family regulator
VPADVHLRSLRSFVAVAEELHFTQAAARLHIAQPALSRQIRALEGELGLHLFDRDRRNVALTPAGAALLPLVRQILHDFDTATEAAAAAARIQDMALRVGFASANAHQVVPEVIRAFGTRRPGWRVNMVQTSWDDPTSGVASGDTDLAFVRLPVFDDTVEATPLLTEPHWVAMAVDHRLARRDCVDFAELAEEGFVAVPAAAGQWRDWWLFTHLRSSPPIVAAETSTPDEWFAAISAGTGIAITPKSTATYYARPGITYRPVTGLPPSVMGLLRRLDDHRSVVADFIQAALAATTRQPGIPGT